MDIHYSFFFYFFVSIILTFLIHLISYSLIIKKYNFDKLSIYECGFAPYNDVHVSIDVHFYLVSVLFIIFDVELVYILPWVLTVDFVGLPGYLTVMYFIFILTVGFAYEYLRGALDW